MGGNDVDREVVTEDQETCTCESCVHYRSVNDLAERARDIWPVRDGYLDDKYREDVHLDQREAYLRGASDALPARGDAATPTEVEWGVRDDDGIETHYGSGTTAEVAARRILAIADDFTLIQRSVSAWREVN